MDIEVRALGALPKGDANGIAAQARHLDKDRSAVQVAIVLFRVPKVQVDDEKEIRTLVPKVIQAELVTMPADAAVVHRILMRAYEDRTGQPSLPFELEIDVNRAFDGLDPDAIAREVAAMQAERAAAAAAAEEETLRLMSERANAEPERDETVGLEERCSSCDWPLAPSPPGEDCTQPEMHMNLATEDDPDDGSPNAG